MVRKIGFGFGVNRRWRLLGAGAPTAPAATVVAFNPFSAQATAPEGQQFVAGAVVITILAKAGTFGVGDTVAGAVTNGGLITEDVAGDVAAAILAAGYGAGDTPSVSVDLALEAIPAVSRAAVFVLLGQSLNAPRDPIVSATGAAAKMPVGGASIQNWQYHSANATHVGHWSELASSVDFTETTAQTPMVGIVNTMTGGRYARTYIGSAAIAARSLEVLMAGGPIANLAAMIYRLCAIARADGFDPEVMFYTAHGEANALANTTEQNYYDLGVEYYSRAQLYAKQAMRQPSYVAPIVFTYPMAGNIAGTSYLVVKEAIRRLALDLPGGIDIGGIYQWPSSTDRVHPTAIGYIQRGEAAGRALNTFTSTGAKLSALHITDVTLSGTEFFVTFSQPVVRDTTLGAGETLSSATAEDGLEWFDNGTAIAITALSYESGGIRGTLASTPTGLIGQQVLRIASQTHTGALASGLPGNLAGSQVRAAGAGWPSVYDPLYTNYEWAAPRNYSAVRAI